MSREQGPRLKDGDATGRDRRWTPTALPSNRDEETEAATIVLSRIPGRGDAGRVRIHIKSEAAI